MRANMRDPSMYTVSFEMLLYLLQGDGLNCKIRNGMSYSSFEEPKRVWAQGLGLREIYSIEVDNSTSEVTFDRFDKARSARNFVDRGDNSDIYSLRRQN